MARRRKRRSAIGTLLVPTFLSPTAYTGRISSFSPPLPLSASANSRVLIRASLVVPSLATPQRCFCGVGWIRAGDCCRCTVPFARHRHSQIGEPHPRHQRRRRRGCSRTVLSLTAANSKECSSWYAEYDSSSEGTMRYIDDESSNSAKEGSAGIAVNATALDETCEIIYDEYGCEAYETFVKGQPDDDASSEQKKAEQSDTNFRWIRLERGPDPCLDNINEHADVVAQIRRVREEQAQYGCADLYERQWQDPQDDTSNNETQATTATATDNDDDQRQQPTQQPTQQSLSDSTSSSQSVNGVSRGPLQPATISVMQFNTLAEGLSAGPNVKAPFSASKDWPYTQPEKQDYGGFTQVPHPDLTFDFARRRWRLLEVILGGATAPAPYDLIALEEVDRFRGFFQPVMRLFGYRGLFVPKMRSPGVRMGWYSDGSCLFWKETIFELVSECRLEYKQGNQVMMIVALRHRSSGKLFVTAVTHLKAQNSETNERIRCLQVNELTHHVLEMAQNVARNGGVDEIPILILGDFNADPPCPTSLSLSPSTGSNGDDNGESGAVETLFKRIRCSKSVCDHWSLKSAYPIVGGDENQQYTTWKTRGAKTVRRIIDYIFYSRGMRCQATLRIPSDDELEDTKLPGLRHPSDHMMIAARFQLVD